MKVRLANGPNPSSGRVEVFHRGRWGTVCDKTWDLRDANVVCAMLGYPSALWIPPRTLFGKGKGKIRLDGIHCNGHEKNLAHCRHKDYVVSGCTHARDAGTVCLSTTYRPRVPCEFLLSYLPVIWTFMTLHGLWRWIDFIERRIWTLALFILDDRLKQIMLRLFCV